MHKMRILVAYTNIKRVCKASSQELENTKKHVVHPSLGLFLCVLQMKQSPVHQLCDRWLHLFSLCSVACISPPWISNAWFIFSVTMINKHTRVKKKKALLDSCEVSSPNLK